MTVQIKFYLFTILTVLITINNSVPAESLERLSPVSQTAISDRKANHNEEDLKQKGAIECKYDQLKKVLTIDMAVPHPNHALIHRPDNQTVWLQTYSEYIHEQIKDFYNLKRWIIDQDSAGTVYVDGKATVQKVFSISGSYHLLIADNLETELENTNHVYCIFDIG